MSTSKSRTPKTEAQKKADRIRIAKGISTLASGASQFVGGRGGGGAISTSANDDNPADVIPESVVNQDKKELTTDLEEKTASSFLSNYTLT